MEREILNIFSILLLVIKTMSDSDLDPLLEEPDLGTNVPLEPASNSSGGRRRSTRLALLPLRRSRSPYVSAPRSRHHSSSRSVSFQLHELVMQTVSCGPGGQSPRLGLPQLIPPLCLLPCVKGPRNQALPKLLSRRQGTHLLHPYHSIDLLHPYHSHIHLLVLIPSEWC